MRFIIMALIVFWIESAFAAGGPSAASSGEDMLTVLSRQKAATTILNSEKQSVENDFIQLQISFDQLAAAKQKVEQELADVKAKLPKTEAPAPPANAE